MKNYNYYLEHSSESEIILHEIEQIIYTGSSKYQKIDIIKTKSFGKCLLLDNKMQSSQLDEFIYHEALVHPAMLLCDNPGKIFIAGGGEGATLREVLKHQVEFVTMVDLDEDVVNLCKKYLPEWSMGAFENTKVKLVIDDARKYITNTNETFDLIILDLPEPAINSPAKLLYTKEFYEITKQKIQKNGIIVTQSTFGSLDNLDSFTCIVKTLQKVFKYVKPYVTYIPSFFALWSWTICSDNIDPDSNLNKIKEKIGNIENKLKFYDFDTHVNMFTLPKYLKTAIEKNEVILTDGNQ